jgi:hypothetical protein
MTDAFRTAATVALVGAILLATAWLVDGVDARYGLNLMGLSLVAGVAYWAFALPGTLLLNAFSTRLAFESLPSEILPPPLVHLYPPTSHQGFASIAATAISAAFYVGCYLVVRALAKRPRVLVKHCIWSMVIGYCGTVTVGPLLGYEANAGTDALRILTRPLAFGFALAGHSYPFEPGFGGSIALLTRVIAIHVFVVGAAAFVVISLASRLRTAPK